MTGLALHCRQCSRSWLLPMRLPMPVDRFLRASKGAIAAGCPHCGAHGAADVLWGLGPVLDVKGGGGEGPADAARERQ